MAGGLWFADTSTSGRTVVPSTSSSTPTNLKLLDDEFPPPTKPQPLELY